MRVVHLTRSAWPNLGGMEASIEGLARAQVAVGMQVCVATLRGGAVSSHGVERVALTRCGPRRYPLALGLPALLADASVVHVHGLDGLADQAVRMHSRVGITTHGGYFHTDRHPTAKALMLRVWTRRTLARAQAVWFSSEADRAEVGFPGEVLGDGIDLSELEGVRQRVPGRWVVPGRVDVHKGIDDLIDVVRAMGVRPQIRLVGPLVRPTYVASLLARARDIDVCVVGEVSREQWLREMLTAEVVICPSRHEGFGIAAAEAMALGVPVVLSDIPAFREHLGGPGVDFRGGDSHGFHVALSRADGAIEERKRRMARHDWSVVAARTIDAYEAMR